ncbi:hypothetical protein OIU74_018866 [Salix koriyanagi]|uniref:Uncharacterized protein n=1 Tax=Salix koriyanagi TaxID=2511006 RepID=A0A9Q1AIY0_9ROSI|nr:hypothetical protein OIU74_018866 [Salix koriyanagi]
MSTSSQQFHFFLLCMIISLSITDGTELIIVNNCKDSIWPGILGTAGHVTPREGGFLLLSGEQTVLQVPDKWSGRIWPRQGCCFDETTGRGLKTCKASRRAKLLSNAKEIGWWNRSLDLESPIIPSFRFIESGWSNGAYKSGEHRAVTNVTAARMSVATFVIPDDDVELGPVETMVDDYNRPVLYKGIKYGDYPRYTFSKKMDGKAITELHKVQDLGGEQKCNLLTHRLFEIQVM